MAWWVPGPQIFFEGSESPQHLGAPTLPSACPGRLAHFQIIHLRFMICWVASTHGVFPETGSKIMSGSWAE